MRGMILAAGRGQRMATLTEHTAKPLLKVNGKYLIEYAIEAFKKANIREIVINISWCAEQIKTQLGNGERYGVDLIYSFEPQPLETAGGIIQALPLLGNQPFVVMSGDIITDYDLSRLPHALHAEAHLILAPTPAFKSTGDFNLHQRLVTLDEKNPFTFASFGIYRPAFFANYPKQKLPLMTIYREKIQDKKITGEVYRGHWYNLSTPDMIKNYEKLNKK